jgi:hypothetical protein
MAAKLILSAVQYNRLLSNTEIAPVQSKPRGAGGLSAYLWSNTGAGIAP